MTPIRLWSVLVIHSRQRYGHQPFQVTIVKIPAIPTMRTQTVASGIGSLMRHLTAARKGGGAIRLYRPTTFTLQSLKLVSLLNLFSVYNEMPEAVASLQ